MANKLWAAAGKEVVSESAEDLHAVAQEALWKIKTLCVKAAGTRRESIKEETFAAVSTYTVNHVGEVLAAAGLGGQGSNA